MVKLEHITSGILLGTWHRKKTTQHDKALERRRQEGVLLSESDHSLSVFFALLSICCCGLRQPPLWCVWTKWHHHNDMEESNWYLLGETDMLQWEWNAVASTFPRGANSFCEESWRKFTSGRHPGNLRETLLPLLRSLRAKWKWVSFSEQLQEVEFIGEAGGRMSMLQESSSRRGEFL